MAYKTVIRLDVQCSKCKKVALHSVTNIEGIDSLTINMKESTLTVIGDADPVCMVQMLRKKFRCAQMVSSGPNPPPPPPPPPKPKCEKCGKEIDPPKYCHACSPPPPKPKLKCEKCGQEYDELKCCPACMAKCIPPCPPCSCSLGNCCQSAQPPPKKCPTPPPKKCPTPPPKKCPPVSESRKCCPPGLPCSCSLGNCCQSARPPPPTHPPTPPPTPPPVSESPKCCPPGLPCSCGLVNCPPPSYGCSSKSEILWPQHRNPFAPEEVYYVWKEDEHETCSIM